ncbi:hypothetical protein [Hymenobacter elongatus]|uniref:Uncharacterized protein n=1 Tax=Hymenobacter elongatus TaxID=877208 RepID=A0A4Z0PG07_9BACT|nr:hypothetical protein [Hymenobacter elongatus]TGE14092.1 hypothetical protein E5J99_17720 [Hymenobacter elongatus]
MKRVELTLLTTAGTLLFTLGFGLWIDAGPALLVVYLVLIVLLPPILALSLSGSAWLVPASGSGQLLVAGLLSQAALLTILWLFAPRPSGALSFGLGIVQRPSLAAFLLVPFWLGLLAAGWLLGIFSAQKPGQESVSTTGTATGQQP